MPARAAAVSRQRLMARAVARARLLDREIESMYEMLSRHFSGVEADVFAHDLAEKNWVVLLEDDSGTLRGFSTFLMYESNACGAPITVVYSGDTIVESAAWGTSLLPRTWIRAVYDL